MTYTNTIELRDVSCLMEEVELLIEELRIENEALKLENERLNRLLSYHVLSEIESK